MRYRLLVGFGWLAARSAGAAELPLRDVTLFTSGVGYFERAATVTGDAQAELSFKTAQMADLLKSLVLLDEGGGRVTAVNYDARDPIERTLRSFGVDLTDNPALPDLLNRLRGATVRLKTGAAETTGTVLGVETRPRRVEQEIFTEFTLNLWSDGAVRPIPLEQIQWLEPTEEKVRAELSAALGVIAGARDREKKTVRLAFVGQGDRKVRVGYMLETPVWKTSYRLVLDEKGPALLQGWAHVENTTEDDWRDVRLTLVSGRPISFIQNLYDPLYLRRPEVRTELQAAAAPPMYEGALQEANAPVAAEEAPAPSAAPMVMRGLFAGRSASGRQATLMKPDASAGLPDAAAFGAGVAAAAEGHEAGELFSYPIAEPVTLPRLQSAMIPILSANLPADKVSIYNEAVNPRHPLNGVEIKNRTGAFLMQGPVTVFEAGIYAGDARLNDTPREADRLLSYAVDLAAEVRPERPESPDQITALKIVHGTLEITRRLESVTQYVAQNKRAAARKFLIEHPLRPDWELAEPAREVEKTRDLYRHRVEIPAGKTVPVRFVERKQLAQTLGLANLAGPQIELYIRQPKASAALKAALKKLAEMQRELQELAARRGDRERRVTEITAEQNRLRENMRTVERRSDSYTMWEGKLVAQERELDQFRKEIEELRADELRRREAIAQFLAELNVE